MSEPVVVRVGDRQRQQVDDALRAALADGVLTLTEYDERAAACWAARTQAELDEVVHDLPDARPVQAPSSGPVTTHHVVAVMSESGLEAPLRPGQEVRATAVMGTAEVDLRREDLPREITVRATAVMGEVKVRVPQGTTVHLSGGAVMGERKAKVGPPVAGGAVVHVVANAVMGTVKVDDRPRKGGLLRGLGSASAALPAQRSGHAPVRHGSGAVSRALRRTAPLVVSAAVAVGLFQVVTADDGAAVFSSRDLTVSQDAEVGVLFGSVTVVVPDGTRVRTTGLSLFGSVDCEDACSQTGRELVLQGSGAFGSIEVLTESEARREAADERAEDAADRDED